MKLIKVLISLILSAVVVLSSSILVFAIGFDAEEIYESVFVVRSGTSIGSGFSVGENCIVTNAHVLTDQNNVVLSSYAGDEYKANVLGINKYEDMAVLIVDGITVPYIVIDSSESIRIGDDIYAIGAPKSMAYTLTKGVISAKSRMVKEHSYIQIDAAINEGSSGGPLLNDSGEVLGINTLKMCDSEGISLAIPMARLCEYLSSLGIELNENGNVIGSLTNLASLNEEGFADERSDNMSVRDNSSMVAMRVIAGISLLGNVVLVIMLIYQKRRSTVLKYDPRDRMDFDIDMFE